MSAVSVSPTWAAPEIVGVPVAAEFSSGLVSLTATSSPSNQFNPAPSHWNWMMGLESLSRVDASVEANSSVPATSTNPSASFGITERISLPFRTPRALTV